MYKRVTLFKMFKKRVDYLILKKRSTLRYFRSILKCLQFKFIMIKEKKEIDYAALKKDKLFQRLQKEGISAARKELYQKSVKINKREKANKHPFKKTRNKSFVEGKMRGELDKEIEDLDKRIADATPNSIPEKNKSTLVTSREALSSKRSGFFQKTIQGLGLDFSKGENWSEKMKNIEEDLKEKREFEKREEKSEEKKPEIKEKGIERKKEPLNKKIKIRPWKPDTETKLEKEKKLEEKKVKPEKRKLERKEEKKEEKPEMKEEIKIGKDGKKIKVKNFFAEDGSKNLNGNHTSKSSKFKHIESSILPEQKIKLNLPYLKDVEEMKKEIARIVVGQDRIIVDILRAIVADGHVLIEGIPGVAKTLLIRAISETMGCKFSRIQFTVDLLPTDITGITTYTPQKGFETIKGPIFTNFVIADEINRAPPKTQSALLEAMQEKQVTIGKKSFKLSPPFFVMANNNPIESSGTYKLPEAQMDRFLFKLNMGYPTPDDEQKVIDQNITLHTFEDFKIKKILSPQKIFKLQKMSKEIQASPQIKKYIIDLVQATRKPKEYNIKLGKYIEWGGSPRASIALYIGAKSDAVLRGQKSITPQNVKNVAHIALRHRLLLNYAGQAENINTDHIIDEILSKVQIP